MDPPGIGTLTETLNGTFRGTLEWAPGLQDPYINPDRNLPNTSASFIKTLNPKSYKPYMGVSKNRGLEYSTLSSRILVIRTQIRYPLFSETPYTFNPQLRKSETRDPMPVWKPASRLCSDATAELLPPSWRWASGLLRVLGVRLLELL